MRAAGRSGGMFRSSFCALKAATALAVLSALAAPVSAQSAETFVANHPYSSDYEVESWSQTERSRQMDYLEQQYLASDELFGGPVRKPGEPRIIQTGSRPPLPGRDSAGESGTAAQASWRSQSLTQGQ